MSRSGGQVKLADFGIAAEGEHAATEFTEFVGTLLYMSPERLKGSATYGFEADIWSFGLTVCVKIKKYFDLSVLIGFDTTFTYNITIAVIIVRNYFISAFLF